MHLYTIKYCIHLKVLLALTFGAYLEEEPFCWRWVFLFVCLFCFHFLRRRGGSNSVTGRILISDQGLNPCPGNESIKS